VDGVIESLTKHNDTQKMHRVAQDLLNLQKTISNHYESQEESNKEGVRISMFSGEDSFSEEQEDSRGPSKKGKGEEKRASSQNSRTPGRTKSILNPSKIFK
jgi:hypothetical protein